MKLPDEIKLPNPNLVIIMALATNMLLLIYATVVITGSDLTQYHATTLSQLAVLITLLFIFALAIEIYNQTNYWVKYFGSDTK